uniref:Si:ch211-168d1.3 n=1 Tax=Dicentrarchus labrax TaxID=13489 RepID=A0A8C4F6D4_DICLA
WEERGNMQQRSPSWESPSTRSQRAFSVLDRLLVTHPVWLQLSLSQDSALYILLREPVGVWTNVLPFPLQLPEAIAKATTHRQLEAISHMGQGATESTIFFLQQPQLVNHSASNKRHRFKRSMRLRLSESSMNLSLEGIGSYSPSSSGEQPSGSERLQKAGTNPQRRVHPGAGVLRRTPAVSPGSRRPAPSLAELDSNSSFSSMDEDNDSDSDPESMAQAQTHFYPRPPLVRSRGRGGLHRMSEAFVCFFAPDKRLTRLVEELSRDRRSTFGGMVQDFLLAQRELLQGLRLFLSQAKCCLLDSGELEPSLLSPRQRAMFSCVLRPLRSHLDKALVELHNQDGSSQRLIQNLLRLKGDAAMEWLGVRTGVPDSREVERVKQKLVLMQRTHSPIDKVLLLLQVCKCVYKAMGSLHGQEVSWDDFLPSLSYVIVECNRPHILIEVEYMMELLEPSCLKMSAVQELCFVKPITDHFVCLWKTKDYHTYRIITDNYSLIFFIHKGHIIILQNPGRHV